MKSIVFSINFLFFIVTFFLSSSAFSAEIHLVSCDWKPYAAEGLPDNGFTCEIISEAFKAKGHSVSFTFLPWRRAMHETERGTFNGCFSAYYNEDRARRFAMSEPYITGPLVLCSKNDLNFTYTNLKDLKPFRVGTVIGYANTKEFDAANFIKKDPVVTDLQNLRKLLSGRVDLIIIDKYLAIYHLKNAPVLEGSISNVRFIDPPLKEQTVHIMFSKAVPFYKTTVHDFNQGLKAIKKNGVYEKILRKHDFY